MHVCVCSHHLWIVLVWPWDLVYGRRPVTCVAYPRQTSHRLGLGLGKEWMGYMVTTDELAGDFQPAARGKKRQEEGKRDRVKKSGLLMVKRPMAYKGACNSLGQNSERQRMGIEEIRRAEDGRGGVSKGRNIRKIVITYLWNIIKYLSKNLPLVYSMQFGVKTKLLFCHSSKVKATS